MLKRLSAAVSTVMLTAGFGAGAAKSQDIDVIMAMPAQR